MRLRAPIVDFQLKSIKLSLSAPDVAKRSGMPSLLNTKHFLILFINVPGVERY